MTDDSSRMSFVVGVVGGGVVVAILMMGYLKRFELSNLCFVRNGILSIADFNSTLIGVVVVVVVSRWNLSWAYFGSHLASLVVLGEALPTRSISWHDC